MAKPERRANMKLNEHIYWQNKTRFDLEEDQYETWTLFAVEEGSFRFEIEMPRGVDRSNADFRLPGSPRSASRSSASSAHLRNGSGASSQSDALKKGEAVSDAPVAGSLFPPASAAGGFPETSSGIKAGDGSAARNNSEAGNGAAAKHGAQAYLLPLAGEAGFGSAVLCPPGGILRRETVTPLTFHYLQFEGVEEPGGVCPWIPGLLTFEDVRRLRSNYAHLRRAEGDASPAGRAWTLHLALDLLRLHQTEQRRDLRPEVRFTEDALMARAAAEIEARFAAPLPLEALAAELGLSPVQFTRRFRAAFGETPSRFLKTLRLERARRLLGDTELTLAEIAERCGYENGFYLSRVFTAENGIAPSEYRRRRRV
ncbi:hypothetical protein B9G55_14640 [Saccharibacillus sp. O16]|nr:hypothetical protein B9G55_14640 [Saccharibacillus sp. O16]